ncbi:MAG: type II and III secretion system protein [Alphaproteobacteria bacterium]|nr:type II and III secretion system protein [Alphaproteobacteria bacterium]
MMPSPLAKRFLLPLLLLSGLMGCDPGHESMHDPALKLSPEDYRQSLANPTPASPPPAASQVPTLNKVTSVQPIDAALLKPVSLSVGEGVPLRDLILELARQTGLDADIDPQVQGSLVMNVQNRPLRDVLDQIATRTNTRYQVSQGFLQLERDLPFTQDYHLDFLNAVRESQGSIGISTDVFGTVAAKGQQASNSGENGSKSKIRSTATADPYGDLETNLRLLLSRDGRINKADDSDKGYSSFSLNRQAGMLTVTGTAAQQRRVAGFLATLQRQMAGQVLIEAKVVEVSLKDEYRSGISWRTFMRGNPIFNAAANFGEGKSLQEGPYSSTSKVSPGFVTLSLTDNDFAGVLGFLDRFGTSRTLSNPRLTVMNNQNAILKVAQNQVYFTLDYERRQGKNGDPDVVTVGSQLFTVPIGLVMSVQPAINPDSQNITLTLRPTISRITGFTADPAVAIASNNTVVSSVPIVEVRELDSVLRLQSGEAIVMGGLMQDRGQNQKEGVPGLKDNVPALLSPLVSAKDDTQEVVELVIFLRATLLPAADAQASVSPADAQLYHKFTRDPRPLALPGYSAETMPEEQDPAATSAAPASSVLTSPSDQFYPGAAAPISSNPNP